MTDQNLNAPLNDFARELLSDIILRSDPSWSIVSVESGKAETTEEDFISLVFVLSGSLKGRCYVQLPLECARVLAERASDGTVDGLISKISSAMRGFRSLHAPHYGDFQAEIELATELEECKTHTSVTLTTGSDETFMLFVSGTTPFVDSLPRPANSIPEPTAEEVAAAEAAVAATASAVAPLIFDVPNLEMVMDVELDVTLRFGQRHLTLREVMDLTSGSVVELDRQVDEPVELLLDGKVIARGEAVVVDGNYGLRVTEVPQPVAARQLRV